MAFSFSGIAVTGCYERVDNGTGLALLTVMDLPTMDQIEAVEHRIATAARRDVGGGDTDLSPMWLRVEALVELRQLGLAWWLASYRGEDRHVRAHRFVAHAEGSDCDGCAGDIDGPTLVMLELAHEVACMSEPHFDALVSAWCRIDDAIGDAINFDDDAPTVIVPVRTLRETIEGNL